jgi:predicted dehydrogenase
LKVGIVGCGAIAQIQYLPIIRDLPNEIEVGALCDLSAETMALVGAEYGVPADRQFTDYHDLFASDIDAVIICNAGSHAAPTIAAAKAGKHVLVEKPMASSVAEAEAMAGAAEEAGVIMMVAYMKRHDPAYQEAAKLVAGMDDIRFVQVNHLHPDNGLHLAKFRLLRGNDLPPRSQEEQVAEQHRSYAEALGIAPERLSDATRRAYNWVLGSMIHDIGNLSGLFGPPVRVISSEIWADGNCISAVIEYRDGIRAVASWIDLPDLQTFEETLEVYASRERVIATFPTGFSIGLPTTVTHHGMDEAGRPWRKEQSWAENPFKLELLHFRDCIAAGRQPSTTGRAAVADIALVREIVLSAQQGV